MEESWPGIKLIRILQVGSLFQYITLLSHPEPVQHQQDPP